MININYEEELERFFELNSGVQKITPEEFCEKRSLELGAKVNLERINKKIRLAENKVKFGTIHGLKTFDEIKEYFIESNYRSIPDFCKHFKIITPSKVERLKILLSRFSIEKHLSYATNYANQIVPESTIEAIKAKNEEYIKTIGIQKKEIEFLTNNLKFLTEKIRALDKLHGDLEKKITLFGSILGSYKNFGNNQGEG